MRAPVFCLEALLLCFVCCGCATVDEESVSFLWQRRDYSKLNDYFGLRCAGMTEEAKVVFQVAHDMILEGNEEQVHLYFALQCMADIAFSYSSSLSQMSGGEETRLDNYEEVICSLLSRRTEGRRSICLRWLYANQHYVTTPIVDAVFAVALYEKHSEVRQLAVTFLSAFFGFVHDGFFFDDDSLPGGIKKFPLQCVHQYWRSDKLKVMCYRKNLSQYARMGFYHDTGVVFGDILRPPTYSPPKEMKLLPSVYPDE